MTAIAATMTGGTTIARHREGDRTLLMIRTERMTIGASTITSAIRAADTTSAIETIDTMIVDRCETIAGRHRGRTTREGGLDARAAANRRRRRRDAETKLSRRRRDSVRVRRGDLMR